MKIELQRYAYDSRGTMGVITLEGERFYTIERTWLDNAPNVSCIPEGTYQMGWRDSPKFGETWHVKDVPDRTHILIHVANFPENVHGCIGLGVSPMGNVIGVKSSKVAVTRFEELTKGQDWELKILFAPHAGL
jgi:hypothetical protein|tara:strand:- start:5482 stop:5880 length:399 start_codon:yes stop_codon:yes gene_type:complete